MIKSVSTDYPVIVKVIYEQQSGAIIIPEASEKHHKAFYGLVIDSHPDYLYEVKAGDKIIFARHEGVPIIYEDQEYLALKGERVLGVIQE